MTGFKSGFVAVVGRPNVGKSTIINSLTGQKIAIVSDKPQTTRDRILGIRTDESSQIIFVDTPGVHRPRNRLGEYMNKVVSNAVTDVDAAMLVVEADKGPEEQEKKLIEDTKRIPVILVINKIDLVKKEALLPLIGSYSELREFAAVVPVSAKRGDGLDELLSEVKKLLPEGPKFYGDEEVTDQQERKIVSEIIREKMLYLLEEEVPHAVAVDVLEMKEEENIVRISANIYCEKESQKPIIIGKGGAMLKKIGSYSRLEIENMLGKKVFLSLWVKVKGDWRNKSSVLRELGYREQ